MKKFVAVLMGIALVFVCVFNAVHEDKSVDTINKESYEKAYEAVAKDGTKDFELEPSATHDGVVVTYQVIVDGNVIGYVNCK